MSDAVDKVAAQIKASIKETIGIAHSEGYSSPFLFDCLLTYAFDKAVSPIVTAQLQRQGFLDVDAQLSGHGLAVLMHMAAKGYTPFEGTVRNLEGRDKGAVQKTLTRLKEAKQELQLF